MTQTVYSSDVILQLCVMKTVKFKSLFNGDLPFQCSYNINYFNFSMFHNGFMILLLCFLEMTALVFERFHYIKKIFPKNTHLMKARMLWGLEITFKTSKQWQNDSFSAELFLLIYLSLKKQKYLFIYLLSMCHCSQPASNGICVYPLIDGSACICMCVGRLPFCSLKQPESI